MQNTTAQSQQESQKTRARLVLFGKPFYKKRTGAHLMSLAQDNGTFMKERHQQHVIYMHTDKQANFV